MTKVTEHEEAKRNHAAEGRLEQIVIRHKIKCGFNQSGYVCGYMLTGGGMLCGLSPDECEHQIIEKSTEM